MHAHWPGLQPWIDCPVGEPGTDLFHQRRHGVPHEESTHEQHHRRYQNPRQRIGPGRH